jgi:hypothetical protein
MKMKNVVILLQKRKALYERFHSRCCVLCISSFGRSLCPTRSRASKKHLDESIRRHVDLMERDFYMERNTTKNPHHRNVVISQKHEERFPSRVLPTISCLARSMTSKMHLDESSRPHVDLMEGDFTWRKTSKNLHHSKMW